MKPGIYPDLPFSDYLAAEACSASACITLLQSFPARLLHQEPDTPSLRLGRLIHSVHLEDCDFEELGLVVVPSGYSDAHVKVNAAEHPEIVEARAAGLEPLREADADALRGMHAALREDPDIVRAFSNGKPEVSVFWEHEGTGMLMKARFDWLPNRGGVLPDLKSCQSIDEAELSRHISTYRIGHRSYFYQEAARAIGVEDPLYCPVFVEKKPPHFAKISPVAPGYVAKCGLEVERAISIYAQCVEANHFPGPTHYEPTDPPTWESKRIDALYPEEVE